MTTTTAMKSFIEVQLPVSRLSKESYKERKSNYSQTLTGLGKWWGRKPLILVRAILLGLLMPTSDDPKKDCDIFLKILTMDNEGLWRRKTKHIPFEEVYSRLTEEERELWFDEREPLFQDEQNFHRKYVFKSDTEGRDVLQRLVFNRLSYDEKLEYCGRPEQIIGPSDEAWSEINSHLGTNANTLQELMLQLGERQFGRTPLIGDAFCGGGSIPFEAARLGCAVYASDLSPVATMLTWAALNIVGGNPGVIKEITEIQQNIYNALMRQFTEWGIENNRDGWRADTYLYCNEVICPECLWMVPLLPSCVIGEGTRTIVKLQPDEADQCFCILIESGVPRSEVISARENSTVKNSNLICPHCCRSTPISMLRGDRRFSDKTEYGLRLWENYDLVPQPDDIFQERLYCIRWIETYVDNEGKVQSRRHYRAPDEDDLDREKKVLDLLQIQFPAWQEKGYIPSRKIVGGNKTSEPIRTRGWTHWHHLFNPRQLLTLGLLFEGIETAQSIETAAKVGLLLSASKCCDYNSRLSRWDPHSANEKNKQVFSNQALNTLFNYSARATYSLHTAFFGQWKTNQVGAEHRVEPSDARSVSVDCDIWLTDPPYADAIYYHELSEFFLAWYDKQLYKCFPEWYTDSKRVLAISGSTHAFRKAMVDCYRNLAAHMSNEAFQVVMFTHQDVSVWADLALILWAAGLRVSTAWCIATETDSALKEGNYVQGTVILVLCKQTSNETAFYDELYPQVENEVKNQLRMMLDLEDKENPNFSDTDYQLASYAAALRVLTQYRSIGDLDVAQELARERKKGEISPIEQIISDAVKVACDYLIPQGFDAFIWRTLTPDERFYLKGLDLESHGEYRTGAYQELARGFGIKEYKHLLSSGKANQTRLKTATEFSTKVLSESGFGASLVRNVLFAIREVVHSEKIQDGKTWLRDEVQDYWDHRKSLIEILRYISKMEYAGERWKVDARASRLLAGALENDYT